MIFLLYLSAKHRSILETPNVVRPFACSLICFNVKNDYDIMTSWHDDMTGSFADYWPYGIFLNLESTENWDIWGRLPFEISINQDFVIIELYSFLLNALSIMLCISKAINVFINNIHIFHIHNTIFIIHTSGVAHWWELWISCVQSGRFSRRQTHLDNTFLIGNMVYFFSDSVLEPFCISAITLCLCFSSWAAEQQM